MLAAKLRKARELKKAKTGRCEGRKPYGFFEGEENLIKRIKQLHRKPRGGKRLGPYQIARILNEEGWPTRKAQVWRGSHVSAILKRLSSRTICNFFYKVHISGNNSEKIREITY